MKKDTSLERLLILKSCVRVLICQYKRLAFAVVQPNQVNFRIMTQKECIENATTKQAVVFIGVYSWIIIRNLGRAINNAVYRLPWLFITLTVIISFIVSFILISKARAERDRYDKDMEHISQQLDSYKAVYDK